MSHKPHFLQTQKGSLSIIIFILLMMLLIFIPKIYLRNNIYYISKDINKLYSHYISLKEENKLLKRQLEDIQFKNQITNSLILRDIEE